MHHNEGFVHCIPRFWVFIVQIYPYRNINLMSISERKPQVSPPFDKWLTKIAIHRSYPKTYDAIWQLCPFFAKPSLRIQVSAMTPDAKSISKGVAISTCMERLARISLGGATVLLAFTVIVSVWKMLVTNCKKAYIGTNHPLCESCRSAKYNSSKSPSVLFLQYTVMLAMDFFPWRITLFKIK